MCDNVGLVAALGFHSIFEGIALGLMPKIEKAAPLAIGLLIHKGVEALALGGTLAGANQTPRCIFLMLLVLGLISVIGVILGVLITKSSKLADVTFLAISAGMMVYGACNGIIVEEFKKTKKCLLAKFFMTVLGASCIVLLFFIAPHSHDHGPGGHGHGHGVTKHANHAGNGH